MTALFDPLFPHSSRRATVRPLISDGKRKNHGENALIYLEKNGSFTSMEKNRATAHLWKRTAHLCPNLAEKNRSFIALISQG